MIEFYINFEKLENIQYNTSYKNETFYTYHALEEQCKKLSIEYKINEVISNIPKQSDFKYICVLNSDTLIHDYYVLNLISLCNIHRNSSLICGPVDLIETPLQLLPYRINTFGSFYSFDITNEPHNFPNFNNIIIPSHYYNMVGGYSKLNTPRGYCTNYNFFKSLSKFGKIVYSTQLNCVKFCKKHELSHETLYKTFYNYGYCSSYFDLNLTKVENFLFKENEESPYYIYFKIGVAEGKTKSKVL